jgi:hypothetical protein
MRACGIGVAVLVAGACCLGSQSHAFDYKGLCEASAGAFIDAEHFAVASDETNRLQIYRRGRAEPIGEGVDMEPFTSFDKSDLEAAARIGDRVYWMSSHSFNSDGDFKPKRNILFATSVGKTGETPTLAGVGRPAKSLAESLAKAAGVELSALNVEAMAATPSGQLLIGLRAPVMKEKALVIPLLNPADVIDHGAAPQFGAVVPLSLGGRGLRSMDLIDAQAERYVIVAGPVSDQATGFAIFLWNGIGSNPIERPLVDLAGIRPEGAMAIPNSDAVQLLSDDGEKNVCDDEKTPVAQRRFRSIDVRP